MWGGRFEHGPDELFKRFNDSLSFDWALAPHDIELSRAWAEELVHAGVISADECASLIAALDDVEIEAAALDAPPVESGAEDIHSWVERRLVAKVGDLGKKLHTGRSRNDQVATGLRMWHREAVAGMGRSIRTAQSALVTLAEEHIETAFPAYTHLQPAQPIVFAHWCLAYFEMLERDHQRLGDALARADRCPLGSAALAGTTLEIDRVRLAKRLGFSAPTGNSLDAVADRDFVLETLAAYALCAVHLSRLAEDLILYSSNEFGLVSLGDEVTSGSSLMPQKKNPDALELIRGKCGRISAAHAGLLMTLKGAPLAYNKDFQEDKEPLFDAHAQLAMCLEMAAKVVGAVHVDVERSAELAASGYSNATELADYLVGKGVPFRDAHDQVGRMVRAAIEKDVPLEGLTLDEMRALNTGIDDDVYGWLSTESALRRRKALGGTSPVVVRDAVKSADRTLG